MEVPCCFRIPEWHFKCLENFRNQSVMFHNGFAKPFGTASHKSRSSVSSSEHLILVYHISKQNSRPLKQEMACISQRAQLPSPQRQGQSQGALLQPSTHKRPTWECCPESTGFLKALPFPWQHIASASQNIKLPLLATRAACRSTQSPFWPLFFSVQISSPVSLLR